MNFLSSSEIEKLCCPDCDFHNVFTFAFETFEKEPAQTHKDLLLLVTHPSINSQQVL